ncbi:hypothetical protein AcW1_003362 [Taiwanofungus camphoratus]|nr:hypothetical protein AcW1_003362 [Antrodia cinnamomea]
MSSIAGYDVWGIVAGVLGTLGLIPILTSIVNDQMPSAKLMVLEETLLDTDSLLQSVSEEGLFTNNNFISETEHRLAYFHSKAEEYRTATYCATTFMKQLKEMMKGLSKRISLLCNDVKDVRADISSTSSTQRKRLHAEGLLPTSGNTAIPSTSVSSVRAALAERPFCQGLLHPALCSSPSSTGCYSRTVTAVPSGRVPAERTMSSQRILPDARQMMPSSPVRSVTAPPTFVRKSRTKFFGRVRYRLYRRNRYRLCRSHLSPPQFLLPEHSETQTLGLSHPVHSPSNRMRRSTETTIGSVKVLDGAKDDNDWEDADECDIETDIPQLLYSAPEIPVLDDRHSVEVDRCSR